MCSNLSWCAHIDNTCAKARKQLGLLYQHFHHSAPAWLLCLFVGPPPDYLYQHTRGYTNICCQVSHRPLVPRLSGPHPTYELASPWAHWKGQKLLLGGSILPPSVFPPHSPTGSITVWHCYHPSTKLLPIFTLSSQVLLQYMYGTKCHLTSFLFTHKLRLSIIGFVNCSCFRQLQPVSRTFESSIIF